MKRTSVRIFATLSFLALCGLSVHPAPAPDSLKPYASASKDCREALERAELLSSQGKWKSAFDALDDFDAANADPYALAMKTSLALRGAVSSAAFRSFRLVDLEEDQDLRTVGQGEEPRDEFPFDPPALAEAQAAKGIAAPGVLSRELGNYYYEAAARFPGAWSMSDQAAIARAIREYSAADGAGAMDGESLLRYASLLVHDGKKVEALRVIDASIAAYGDGQDRINAIVLGARTASQLGDSVKEEGYYAKADKAFPKSPTPGILRHMIAVEKGRKKAAETAAEGLVAAYGSNPNVVRAIVSSWVAAGERATARAFLERSIAKGGADGELCTLNFYLAVLIAQGDPSEADRAAGLAALDAAAAHLKAAGSEDLDVFRIMDGVRASLTSPSAARTEK
jgi:hypothetical protein